MKNNKRKNIRKAYPVSKGTLYFLLLLKRIISHVKLCCKVEIGSNGCVVGCNVIPIKILNLFK